MMDHSTLNLLAADAILGLHALIVAFNVIGLVLIVLGGILSWAWIRNPWFRVIHLATILMVVMQSWLGAICPLTKLEMALRSEAGDAVYSGSFVAYWLANLLYVEAPAWAFTLVYTLFGVLVVASWFLVRPRSFGKRNRD